MKRTVLFLLPVVVLAALAWWLTTRDQGTSLDAPLSDFTVADTARVDRIFITDVSGAQIDLRRSGARWTVNGTYEARSSDIQLLLNTFKRIEVKSPVSKKAQSTALRYMGAVAKRVEIYTGGRTPEKVWIVGHAAKDNLGTYMVLELPEKGRSSAPFVMKMAGFTGILNTRFHTDLDQWRRPVIWDYTDPYDLAQVEVEIPKGPGTSFSIQQGEDNKVRLLDRSGRPLPMDTSRVKLYLRAFRNVHYEAIERRLLPASRDSLLAATPDHVVRTQDRAGERKEVRFWYMPYKGAVDSTLSYVPQHDVNSMYAYVDDSLVVVVQRPLFDLVLEPAEQLQP
jgi:hypothetical protein